jgi:hypothetical protein
LRAWAGTLAGRRAFLIGNGPSLNETPVERLHDEITFGVNNIYLHFERMGFQPTFYFAEDATVIRHHRAEINERITDSCKVFPYVYRHLVAGDAYVNYVPLPRVFSVRFGRDATRRVFWGGVCTYAVMQIAYYLGVERLYLIGLDHNWLDLANGGRSAHFTSSYFKEGARYQVQERMDVVEDSYRKAREVYESDGRQIVNCTRGGRLEVFDRQPLESVLALRP